MTVIIDGRGRRGSGIASDQLWRQRAKSHAREAFRKAIEKTLEGDFKDIGNKGIDVPVPQKGVSEPSIHTNGDGIRRQVRPGNKEFQAGDKIEKPKGGGGGKGGNQAGEGEGQDSYTAHLDKDEVRRMLFDGLGLPYLEKKSAEDLKKTQSQRAGLSIQGAFHNIDLARTKKRMLGRILAASSGSFDEVITLLKEKTEILASYDPMKGANLPREPEPDYVSKAMEVETLESDAKALISRIKKDISSEDGLRLAEIDEQISGYKNQISIIPNFNESTDPRFKRHEQRPVPQAKAVMFCLMDVSYSMDEEMKKNAKLFFWLLYNLLTVKYGEDNVKLVFIRHTETAKEVNSEEFFNSKESGGTKVSSALKLQLEIAKARFSGPEWNIYGSQVSDGDNTTHDNVQVRQIMPEIMKLTQAYCYMETKNQLSQSDLWPVYNSFMEQYGDRFKMAKVGDRKDVLPMFRKLYAEASGRVEKPAALELA